MEQTFDIAIVGAGMIGTTLACLMAKQGLKVALIDRGSLPKWGSEQHGPNHSPRVSALNHASVNVLAHIDTWTSIKQRHATEYQAMSVWETHSLASISFNAETLGHPNLGHIVVNNAVTSTHVERLTQNYLVSVFDQTEVSHIEMGDQDGGNATLDIDCQRSTNKSGVDQIKASLVVGADGSHSLVRAAAGIESDNHDYEQTAIVTTVDLADGHKNTAWQCFLDTGPVAMLPFGDKQCSIVWSCDNSEVEALSALSDAEFCDALSGVFQSRLGKVTGCGQRNAFPIRQQHAQQYIAKRCVLVGDAAHITHPLGGLGANIGFMDAAVLSQVINHAQTEGKHIANHSVLRRYERWRKGENARVLTLMKTMKTLFSKQDQGTQLIRQIGLETVNQLSPIKHQLALHAMGIAGDLPDICKTPRF